MRAWITFVGLLGAVTTRILGFTVDRSNAGAFGPANWPDATLDGDRRTSIEMLLNGKMFSADLDNILRDSEIVKSVKEENEKCSSTSEESQRAKRSEDILANGTHLTSSEAIASDFTKPTAEKLNRTHHRSIEAVSSESTEATVESSSKSHLTSVESIVSKLREPTVNSSKKPHILSSESNVSKSKESKIESSTKLHLTSSESNVSKSKESKVESSTKLHLTSSESIVLSSKKPTVESSSSPEMITSVVTSENTSDIKAPRNVVLMLIDDSGIGRETMWKNFATSHKFAVQGFVQNCRPGELRDRVKFSSSDSRISRHTNDECECDRFLRFNVESLLSWARQAKEMNTATVSATNFTIPAPFGSEKPTIEVKEFEDNEEANGLRQDVLRFRPDNRNSWNMLDLEKQSTPPAPSVSTGSPAKQDGINGYDGMWDVFDMFSRIRIAFFRILLESLGTLSGSEDELAGRRVFAVQPSIVELITDALKDIKSVPNDKGYMLVASAPGNEMSSAVEVLRREISANDTLLIVVGICSKKNERIPFFAEGPGDENLRAARAVWNLPILIRNSMSSGCPDEICNNEPRAEPVATLQIRSLPEHLPRKRVVRAKEDEETSEPAVEEKSTKETVEEVEENKSTPVIGKRSGNGAEKMRFDAVTGILGIATSVTAMLALNS